MKKFNIFEFGLFCFASLSIFLLIFCVFVFLGLFFHIIKLELFNKQTFYYDNCSSLNEDLYICIKDNSPGYDYYHSKDNCYFFKDSWECVE